MNSTEQTIGYVPPYVLFKRIEVVKPLLKGWVLEYSAGTGSLAPTVSYQKYVGVEVDDENLHTASRKFPNHQFLGMLPETGAFDTIVALSLVEHLQDPQDVLLKFQRILAKDGRIVITTPKRWTAAIYSVMSALGLFKKRMQSEHDIKFDYSLMQKIAQRSGLQIEVYKSFLWGANQIFVFKKR
jgi:2-polyprenyl-3-methyl-5-hydroxy-6-metoxy-1,4-benzoquinol methylase